MPTIIQILEKAIGEALAEALRRGPPPEEEEESPDAVPQGETDDCGSSCTPAGVCPVPGAAHCAA